ncbi:ABC transporter permease [Streptomyces cinerochromogenes]|uniref:ABC transporter permease n=1 Tax=Streptomyces cinerochromogenes TaxID=66422 RepID=UPI00167103FC|nr:FtsX-like permease family protein [Streptomyces cinerochromogenes]GGS43109.1 ABC transporter permease [Streptomyces cinerochromogenes]
MIRIALRTLRFHKGGFLASFLALFAGAVIVIGSGGLLETGIHSAAPPHRLAAAPVVVTGDQNYRHTRQELVFPERLRMDAALADRIAKVPGVGSAVQDISFPAALARGGTVTGHGWSSAKLSPYRLTDGTAPTTDGRIVLGRALAERAGVRTGERIRLLVHGTEHGYRVSGLAAGPDDGTDVFLKDAEAATVAGLVGRTDTIGVFPASGADPRKVAAAVREAVGDAQVTVLTGDDRGRAENPDVVSDGSDLIPLAAAFGGLSAMVTIFVVASTLGLSIQQRQREMALLRTIGSTPGQLRRLILGETLVLAVVATGLAVIPGPRFGHWLLDAFADAGVVPDAIAYRAGSVPVIAGVGTALLTAVGSAYIAAQSAARTRPTEALAEATLQRRWFSAFRLVVGVLCLVGGAALAWGTSRSAGPDAAGVATPAAMVWAAAFGLLGPVVVRGIVAVLRRPVGKVSGLAGELAAHNARARTARLASAVMPVMLASGLAIGLMYMQTTQSEGAQKAFDDNLRADVVVTSASGGLPLGLVDTVRRQPGVAAASAQIPTTGYIEPDRPMRPADGEDKGPQPTELSLQGVTPQGLDRTTAYRAVSGSLTALDGDSVALPARYAEDRRLGDLVPMRLGDGTQVRLRLVATVDGRRGYETALVPASVLLGHTDGGLVPQIMVRAAAGTTPAQLTENLSRLERQQPGLRVSGTEVLTAARAKADDTQAWMAYLVLGVVVGYATLALINTQVLATTERRKEFMLQRLVGATRRQVLQMMTVEASLVALAGIVLGLLVAVATLVPLSMSVLGTALPGGSPWILVVVLAGAAALTLATTLLAAGAVLRGRPGDMAGIKE